MSEEIIELRNKLKESELRMKALISVLSREGIVTAEEVEKELSQIISKDE